MTNSGLQVLVAGSGVMGAGIARGFAARGITTAVLSRRPEAVAPIGEGVDVLGALPEASPALIIESIPEIVDLKLELYGHIEAAYQGAAVLASNTSGLPLEELAAGLRHPDRFCGIHYFQPADVAPLVEIARIGATEDAALRCAVDLVAAAGKTPIVLNEPIPGLLINRLQHAVLHEAYYLIERGICTAADVDRVAKQLLGPRMSITGLIEQKDLSGLDTHALAQAAIVPELHHGAVPSAEVQDKPGQNRLGIKTGQGFYDWRPMDVPAYRTQTTGLLSALLDWLGRERPEAPALANDDD